MKSEKNDGRVSLVEKHIAETILSVGLIIITIIMKLLKSIDDQTAWIITILTATMGLSIALTKDYFWKVAEVLVERRRVTESKSGTIGAILEALGGKGFKHANSIVDKALEKLKKIPAGRIPLEVGEYFEELFDSIQSVPANCTVLAVNSINMSRWVDDPRQRKYERANFDAIKRGIKVRRVFLLEKKEMESQKRAAICSTIAEQKSNGVQIDVVWLDDIRQYHELHDDFVLFDHAEQALFLDVYDPHDTSRVLSGELITDQKTIGEYQRKFERLLKWALEDHLLAELLNGPSSQRPG
jgi:hypothetical protein